MAQTLKFGNGTWATKKGSILAHNDEGGNFKPLPFTYTGAGKGTRVNKEGLIEVVENDRPRIDYLDSADGVFLLEKAATNLITYSEDFNNVAWSKTNTTITSGFTSPDGSLNANSIVGNGTSGLHYILKSLAVLTGQDYTVSVFAKEGTNSFLQLNLGGAPFGSSNYCNFNLSKGTIGSFGNTTSNRFIEKLVDGWYRIGFTATSFSSGSSNFFPMLITSATSSFLETNTLDTSVQIFGSQIEVGNLSSYIPTQGTIQTRVQETASGSGNSEVFNDSEGVLFADISALANDGTYRFLSVSAGAYANSIRIGYFTTPNVIEFRVVAGGIPQTQPTHTLSDTTIPTKVAGKYKQNDFALWVNGFKVDADTNGNTPSGLSELAFDDGNNSSNSPFYGKTKEIAYYDEILTDLELETLTSYRTWEEMVKELNLNIIHNE